MEKVEELNLSELTQDVLSAFIGVIRVAKEKSYSFLSSQYEPSQIAHPSAEIIAKIIADENDKILKEVLDFW